jgi:hypothetical protein
LSCCATADVIVIAVANVITKSVVNKRFMRKLQVHFGMC